MKNRMVKGKRGGIIILAVAVTVALLLTSCAPGPPAGEKVVKVAADDMMSVTQIYSNYARFVEQGMPLIFMEQQGAVIGLKERAEKDQVVLFVAEYFMENWQEERAPRLAFIGMDSPWGREPEYATEYCQGLGFEVLPLELTPFVTLDATTILLRLRESGADLVYIQALPMAVGPILRDAERLGIVGQMTFAGHQSGMGDRVIQMAGIASEGYLIPRLYPWFGETDIPGIELMLDTQMKYHGKEMREGEVFFGWVAAPVVCEAVRRAIENVGYENVDGAAIKEALDSIKDFDVYGLATVTYEPGDHRGVTKVGIHQVRDGKMVRVTDWREVPMVASEG
jgi:ABC-type branched-subunit amino acid transport system substrate-binding protein